MYMKNPVNDVNTSYFSEAELRVVKLLASGSSEKEIADRLVSHATLLTTI